MSTFPKKAEIFELKTISRSVVIPEEPIESRFFLVFSLSQFHPLLQRNDHAFMSFSDPISIAQYIMNHLWRVSNLPQPTIYDRSKTFASTASRSRPIFPAISEQQSASCKPTASSDRQGSCSSESSSACTLFAKLQNLKISSSKSSSNSRNAIQGLLSRVKKRLPCIMFLLIKFPLAILFFRDQ